MFDKRCFVQFSHPGPEHAPDSDGKIGWNRLSRTHKRKFMQLNGEWIDKDSKSHTGELRAWGEWEPESKVLCKFDIAGDQPRYLWKPYWIPKTLSPSQSHPYEGLHNTDPFIFGDHFLYSNCGQSAPNKAGLRQLAAGSVIIFGSGKAIGGEKKWVLDTVFVVQDSFLYDPRKPHEVLAGKVSPEFLEMTGGPLTAHAEGGEKANATCAPPTTELRLYRGATPSHSVHGMFSFFPAIRAEGNARFARPVISLDGKHFTPESWQAAKGTTCHLDNDTLRGLWDLLVKQVLDAGLFLGTYAEMPPRREE